MTRKPIRQNKQRFGRKRRAKKSRPAHNSIVSRAIDLGVEYLEPRWVLASPGSLDTTFDFDGILTGDFGAAAGTDVKIQAVAVQADGKIVVAGMIDTTADPIEDVIVGRFNADGSLDTTFGDNDGIGGYTTFTFNGQQSFASDVGIDASGNIVVVGKGVNAALTQNGFGVARLSSDGELDNTFGTLGRVVTTFTAGSDADARSVAFQSDGKIVVAGIDNNPNSFATRDDFALARYNANGTLDTTFDGDGKLTTDFNARDDSAFGVVIQNVGLVEKILVVGEADRSGLAINDFAMARYNPNGSLDATFGTAGKLVTVTGVGALASQVSTIGAVTLDSAGRIVVAGTVGDINTATDVIIGRYTASGVLDTTFNPTPVSGTFAGTLRIDFALIDVGANSHASIVAQPDGKYVIGGSVITTTTSTTAGYRYGLARVGAAGSLDSTFGTGGLVQVPAFPDGGGPDPPFEPAEPDALRMMDLALTPDGKLLAAGWVDLETTEPDFLLARYETGLLTAEAGGPYAINEPGGSVVLNGSAVGSAPFTYEWDLDGDTVFGETGAGALNGDEVGANPTFTASGVDGPSVLTVTLRVTDSTSVTAFDTATINVLNVPPTLTVDSGAVTVDEGQTANNSGTFGDILGDPVSLVASIGVVTGSAGVWNWSYNTTDDAPTQAVTITATDGDGGSTSVTFDLTVNNLDPSLTVDTASVAVDEGQTATNSGTFGDVPADTVTLAASIGAVVGSAGVWSWSYNSTDDLATQTVTITATDGDGGSTSVTFDLTVNNLDPSLTVDNATVTVDEGQTATNSGTFGDVAADTVTLMASIGVVAGSAGAWTWTYGTTDDAATQTVTITATDEDGGSTSVTFDLTINNIAPTLAISGAADVDEGASYTLNLSSFDPGDDTIASWTINWGDVTEVVSGNPTSVSHTYADGDANYTISASATDEDGTFAAGNTVAVTVNNVDPTANDATFSVTENAPNGTVIGTVSASDQGDDTLSFSIVGGTGAAAFAVDSGTGEITVANSALLDFEATPTLSLEVEVSDGNGGFDTATITINLINQASISGVVFVDINQNGLFDANEPGIDGVVINLLDASGNPVLDSQGDPVTAVTTGGGFYLFEDLDAATYQLFEVQPSGLNDGAEHLGSLGGSIVANDRMQLTLAHSDAYDYAFAELGQQLTSGDAATIGFWQNKHGQALITQGGTQLANWLTANFANVFGNTFVGASGSAVAAFYRDQLFKQTGKKSAGPAKVDAQFLAVAFATYFTSSYFAGNVAAAYGFHVTDTGIGTKIVNVGTKGAAFGVANGTNRTIMQLLLATDALTDQPDSQLGFASVYDTNGDGTISSAEAILRTMANDIYSFINEAGGV